MEISVEKLGELQPEDCVICDIRGEHDRAYGFIPGSVGISAEELLTSPPADGKKLIIYCARGIVSVDLADELCGRGLEAYSLEGGYIAWLRAEMRRRNDEELRERVEQSIRKKFRVSLMSKFIKALKTYQLVNEGDRVAVCISGGKDSMLMAKLFQELKRYSEVNFEVKYLVMDPGYNADNRRIIEDNARALGIPVTIFETDIFESVYNVEKSPCYLCARMRRGYLYRFAQELGRTDEIREWIAKAEFRRARILQYCYDPEAKQFYDYDYVNGRRSDVLSGAVFALLYSGAVPREYAGDIVQALVRLEFPYGIAACEDKPYDYPYQWSYPNTWPPVCFYAVMGLARYGYGKEAERIAVKWMKAVTESFKTTGNLWEKYNAETGTTDVSNEYEMPAMLGWTAGTFICLDDYLAGEMQPDPLPSEYMSY